MVLAGTSNHDVQLKPKGISFLWHCVDMPIVGRWLAFVASSLGVSWLREPLRRQRCLGSVSSFRVTDAAVRGRVLTHRDPPCSACGLSPENYSGGNRMFVWGHAVRCVGPGRMRQTPGVLPVGGLTRRVRRLPCVTTPDPSSSRGVAARRRLGGQAWGRSPVTRRPFARRGPR